MAVTTIVHNDSFSIFKNLICSITNISKPSMFAFTMYTSGFTADRKRFIDIVNLQVCWN